MCFLWNTKIGHRKILGFSLAAKSGNSDTIYMVCWYTFQKAYVQYFENKYFFKVKRNIIFWIFILPMKVDISYIINVHTSYFQGRLIYMVACQHTRLIVVAI